MKKLIRVAAALAVALTLTAAPASAANSATPLQGTTVATTYPPPNPDVSGCPAGYDWMWVFSTIGTGTLHTDAYNGAVSYVSSHCTRIGASGGGEVSMGKLAAGTMELTTPRGKLVLAYEGMFVNWGANTTPFDYLSQARMQFTVDGSRSTGVFLGASGHGVLRGFDEMTTHITPGCGVQYTVPGVGLVCERSELDINGSVRLAG